MKTLFKTWLLSWNLVSLACSRTGAECWWREWLWCHDVALGWGQGRLCEWGCPIAVCLSGRIDWQQCVRWLGGFVVGWRCMQKQGQVQCFRLGVMAGIAGWRVCEGVRWGGVVGLREGCWEGFGSMILCCVRWDLSTLSKQRNGTGTGISLPPHPKHYPPKNRNTNPAKRTPKSIIWAYQSIN